MKRLTNSCPCTSATSLGVLMLAIGLFLSSPALAQTDCPAEGDCCSVNGTPGCNDAECCELICGIDAFCCDTEWDALCAVRATFLCNTCHDCPGEGACCSANGTPGCNDAECCNTVCTFDPFCCQVEWDGFCAFGAAILCDNCGACPGQGACCDPEGNGTPGCNNGDCCSTVCEADFYCCRTEWDAACASQAAELCPDLCAPDPCPGEGDCCQANSTPSCNDADCCSAVCDVDPSCCDTEWDAACANQAVELCDDLCRPACGEGDCCEANGSAGCNDGNCCESVCAYDSFCCETEWDAVCVELAILYCDGLCTGEACGEGDCCVENGSPGCEDPVCCIIVCNVTPFCCDVEWDAQCVSLAGDLCPVCGGSYFPECGDTFCEGPEDAVSCPEDCAEEPLPCPGDGDCCTGNGTPGCNDEACCNLICGNDAFCCDVSWDGVCVDTAIEMCDVCSTP